MDRFGTKIGYSLALTVWSLAAMSHALARSAFGFGVARAALGVGEAGNFPAAIKTVAEWFPRRRGPWPPAFSTRARMSAPSSRRSPSRTLPRTLAGNGLS